MDKLAALWSSVRAALWTYAHAALWSSAHATWMKQETCMDGTGDMHRPFAGDMHRPPVDTLPPTGSSALKYHLPVMPEMPDTTREAGGQGAARAAVGKGSRRGTFYKLDLCRTDL